jgi:subtilisin family serine protease
MKTIRDLILAIFCLSIGLNAFGAMETSLLHSRFASWGVNPKIKTSINLLPVFKKFTLKKNVNVAVVDTGIDEKHLFLKPSHITGYDFSGRKAPKGIAKDEHGHGTHVSGIIRSVFPKVKIITLKYYNPNASGLESLNATLNALKHAVDLNVDVINYSGGGPEASLKELKILKEANRKGILVVCAAGNDGKNIDSKRHAFYPASYGLKNIISVTAHDKELNTLNSSNYGVQSVDISAPGYRIKSALPFNRAGYLTGTSQATAFVSGVAALIKSNFPEFNMFEIKHIILKGSKKELAMKGINGQSARLDANLAYDFAAKVYKDRDRSRILAYKKGGPKYGKTN